MDVEKNQQLQAAFRIQSIPAVKAFKDGRVAAEFTGALPPAEVERFFDALVPSEADELAASGDEEALRRAARARPEPHDRPPRARQAAAPARRYRRGDRAARGRAGRLRGRRPARTRRAWPAIAELAPAFEAWDEGDHGAALERLQEAFQRESDPERRDPIRRVMVALFTELGPDDPLARDHRRRLSAALY